MFLFKKRNKELISLLKMILSRIESDWVSNDFNGLCFYFYWLNSRKIIRGSDKILLKKLIYSKIKEDNSFNRLFYSSTVIRTTKNSISGDAFFFPRKELEPRLKFLQHILKQLTK